MQTINVVTNQKTPLRSMLDTKKEHLEAPGNNAPPLIKQNHKFLRLVSIIPVFLKTLPTIFLLSKAPLRKFKIRLISLRLRFAFLRPTFQENRQNLLITLN